MPDSDPIEEQAAEYVLGQLDEQAKADFEARLASTPALRAAVQEFESACEALALTAPQARPGHRVWQRIARRTTAGPIVEPAVEGGSWWHWLRFASQRGWVVALCLAVGWLVSDSLRPGPRSAQRLRAERPGDSAADASRDPARVEGPHASSIGAEPSSADLHSGASNTASVTGGTASVARAQALEEAQRLRAWVQQLAGEVADLNRRLAQEATFPAGSGRYQLFRLTATNGLAGPGGYAWPSQRTPGSPERVLEQLLAGALARQLVVLQESPPHEETRAAGEPAQPSDTQSPMIDTVTNLVSAPTEPVASASFQVVELAASNTGFDATPLAEVTAAPNLTDLFSVPTGDTAGLGFYSSDTGRGTLALVIGQTVPTHQILQFWALDGDKGGTISLGTSTASGAPMLIQFSMEPGLFTNPGFMVTLEPVGGSLIPTGPVVVRPPNP